MNPFALIGFVFSKIVGSGVVGQFANPMLRAYEAKLDAQNDADRLDAERDIARLEAQATITRIEASDRMSARRIGSLLIVVPFGIWYGGIYLVSVLNGLFGWHLVILDVPARTHEIAMVLVPAILVSEASERITSLLSVRRK